MTQTVKQFLKYFFAYTLFVSGFLDRRRKKTLKNRVVVLMYHRVLKSDEMSRSFSNNGIIVHDNTFKKHIEYLTKHFNIISLQDLIKHLDTGTPFKDCTCLITFDDGWIDNYTNAFPVLKKYSAPALIFLPIDFIGSGNLFWQEKLAYYLHSIAANVADGKNILREKGVIDSIDLPALQISKQVTSYIASLKKLDNREIDNVLGFYLAYAQDNHALQSDNGIDSYMNWEQVSTMHSRGISFGSHAVSHRLLSKFSDMEIEHEVSHSKKTISSRLADKVDSIAYPNGDFNNNVINKVKKSGYKIAFSTNSGYFSVDDDPYQVRRINIHQNAANNVPMLLCRILKIF